MESCTIAPTQSGIKYKSKRDLIDPTFAYQIKNAKMKFYGIDQTLAEIEVFCPKDHLPDKKARSKMSDKEKTREDNKKVVYEFFFFFKDFLPSICRVFPPLFAEFFLPFFDELFLTFFTDFFALF